MVRYLPPFEVIKGMLNLTTSRGKTRADLTYEDAQKLIQMLLDAVEVDESYYLDSNPDVAEGIRLGNIRSAQEHFVDHGYFEGRLPYRIMVNEEWYLAAHQDVAQNVQFGEYKSGQDHFDGPGYSEGRAPYPIRR